ncbi:MAG: cbb3-type cytochrome c oxidase subunit I [Acidobacteriota bacterium]
MIETRLVRAHALAAFATLLVSVSVGIVMALQLVWPDIAGHAAPLGWGRLRYAHTQGIMLGWLGNAFLAFLYHAVPILTGRPVTSARLGQWLFGLWNAAVVVPGWVLVLAGMGQPLEWAEFPLLIDAVVILALLVAAVQFIPPFFRQGVSSLYVSSWYIVGSLVFTLLAYPMGNLAPELLPGAGGAAFSGLWIHDAVGLFVTPLALAIVYFVIPAATGRPIYSHFLSMLGFWLLFFLYPLNGTHHYVYSVIPMPAQLSAITASALLGVTVVIVVFNLFMSMRGSGFFPRDVALRFVGMSTFFYIVVSLQGASQAQMMINQTVHFTDWVIGHSHLAMLGFASFAAIGGLVHAWSRLPAARVGDRALDWAFWLLTGGVAVMVIDLTVAGLVQAGHWQSNAPWIESVRASRPYWLVRALSAIPLTAGFIALAAGLRTSTALAPEPQEGAPAAPVTAEATHQPRVEGPAATAPAGLSAAYLVASVAGVGFFVMSVGALGVWPARVLEAQTAAMSPPSPLGLTASETRGRLLYGREGCAYCHTQQVRYLAADTARFGAPTLAWETRFDFPQLWGTRRIGPDLARAGGTRSADWQFAHLFAPRLLVPDSVMPAYPWLFDGAPDRPRQEARDLVAYLESLGRAREIAGPEGDAHAREACACPDDEMKLMAFEGPLNAHPARTRREGAVPALPPAADRARGLALYAARCATCHGPAGDGDGPGGAGLLPRPANLAAHEYTPARVAEALWNGVAGSAMPAWRDRSLDDLAALTEAVRSLHRREATPVPPDLAALGAEVYATHCVQCHGERGDGRGTAADELVMAPTSFVRQRPALTYAVQALREGIPGTPMVPWTPRLSSAEIVAVAHHVRSFYQP